jgi:hypothetical protein
LDILITAPARDGKGDEIYMRVGLSPVEIYVLLAATLFHDVGRIKGDPHGYKSGKLVQDKYADLGVPSRELASSIARVCAFHDWLEAEYSNNRNCWFDRPESKKVIDPFGGIREYLLATLLRLADHLDSVLTRVMPLYLRPFEEIEVVGAFRSVISGVEVDHDARMICTILGDIPQGKPREDVFRFKRGEDRCLPEFLEEDREANWDAAGLEELVRKKLSVQDGTREALTVALLERLIEQAHRDRESEFGRLTVPAPGPVDPQRLRPSENQSQGAERPKPFVADTVRLVEEMMGRGTNKFEPTDWLLARRVFQLEEKKKDKAEDENAKGENRDRGGNKDHGLKQQGVPAEELPAEGTVPKWHPLRILAIVLGDVLKNARALVSIRDDLAAMGIPIRAWLIEGHERLFNLWGEETYEPIFTKDYLKDVACSMWGLSTSIFGQSLITYQNLADQLREPHVEKVRRAVRRVAIVMRPERVSGDNSAQGIRNPIEVGDQCWWWSAGDPSQGTAGRWCSTKTTLREVIDTIDRLGDPV